MQIYEAGMIDILVIATFIISMSPSFCYARPPSSDFSLPAPVTVAVIFFISFFFGFLTLYFCRCILESLASLWNNQRNPSPPVDVAPSAGENISNGLDPELIQAFPTFYYSTVKEFRREKYGLECAICLGEFKDEDMLRLLTICCHVFHKECVDLWLESHKTCPVCRGELGVLSKKSPLLIRSNSMHEISTNAESSANQSPVEDSVCIDIKDDNDEKVDGEDKVQVTSSTKEQQSRKNEKMEKFSRSHSTGHSIGRAKEEDRYTLGLPEHIKIKIVRGHHAARSCTVFGEFTSPSNDRHRGSGEPSETRIGD
ncbi:RING-H2 finger protein ATL29 [Gossypium australe]|uniref:RING-type E3 ubiquitin transferase n=1 Tax=Gossypium australe TaxID=47621 RepID=A0A5B6V2G6_9ROSI|nr:RING-H2 finger protein ATL29 [Gossypium australe]